MGQPDEFAAEFTGPGRRLRRTARKREGGRKGLFQNPALRILGANTEGPTKREQLRPVRENEMEINPRITAAAH